MGCQQAVGSHDLVHFKHRVVHYVCLVPAAVKPPQGTSFVDFAWLGDEQTPLTISNAFVDWESFSREMAFSLGNVKELSLRNLLLRKLSCLSSSQHCKRQTRQQTM